jgi:hypothetical protein
MGHSIRNSSSQKKTPKVLKLHPNLNIPDPPEDRSEESLINYILESAARFVSPPKVQGEDVEFLCDDLARAIREDLRKILIEKMTGKDQGTSS